MARGIMPAALAVALAVGGCGGDHDKLAGGPPGAPGGIVVTSPDFAPGGPMPADLGCDGAGRRPALRWSGVPRGAREIALLVTDRDAGGFVHWTAYGIAPATRALGSRGLPRGAREGRNSFGHRGWGGPCPPHGEQHRYVFAVYWLRRASGLEAGAAPAAVADAVSARAGGSGRLVGRYHRSP